MRKTLEAQGDPFRRGLPTLQTSPNFPTRPHHFVSKNLFCFSRRRGFVGKFFRFGRWKFGAKCGYRTRFEDGMREMTRGVLPADCTSAGCVTRQKCNVVGNDPCVVPVWGKDTDLLQWNPAHECRDPARKSGATAALCNRFIPPEITKISPMPPPLSESESNFRFVGGGVVGEVLGERGRFGGREPHLSRGGSLPPRSFQGLSPPMREILMKMRKKDIDFGEGV